MDIGDVYRSVALVASDAATNPHPQGLPSILPNRDCLLRQLRPLNPQSFLEKLRHFRVRMVICTRGRNTSWKWNNGGKFGPTDWEYQWCLYLELARGWICGAPCCLSLTWICVSSCLEVSEAPPCSWPSQSRCCWCWKTSGKHSASQAPPCWHSLPSSPSPPASSCRWSRRWPCSPRPPADRRRAHWPRCPSSRGGGCCTWSSPGSRCCPPRRPRPPPCCRWFSCCPPRSECRCQSPAVWRRARTWTWCDTPWHLQSGKLNFSVGNWKNEFPTRMALRPWLRFLTIRLVIVSGDCRGLSRGLLPRNHQHHFLVVLSKLIVLFYEFMQIFVSNFPSNQRRAHREDNDKCGAQRV